MNNNSCFVCSVFVLLLSFSSAASSLTRQPEDLSHSNMLQPQVWNAVQNITDKLAQEGQVIDSAAQQALAETISALGFDVNAEDHISELGRVLGERTLSSAASDIEGIIPKVRNHIANFFMNRDGNSGLALGMLLFPYMEEAGLCSGAVSSEAGVECALTIGSEGADVSAAGTYGDVQRVNLASTIGKILSRALGRSEAQLSDSGDDYIRGEEIYTFLGFPITAEYGAYYRFKYRCQTSCRASAEGFGAIRGKYLFVGSDSVFASAAAAIYCDFFCSLGALADAVSEGDVVAHVLDKGDKRYPVMSLYPKARHTILPACGMAFGVAQASPAHYVLANADFDLPYDVGVDIEFGTNYQDEYDAELLKHVALAADPKPSALLSYEIYQPEDVLFGGSNTNLNYVQRMGRIVGGAGAAIALLGQQFNFTQSVAWRFNVIFVAVNKLNPIGNACWANVKRSSLGSTISSAYVSGSQFWTWQQTGSTGEYAWFGPLSFAVGFKF